MADEPENLTLVYLCRIDEKLDRLADDVGDLRQRVTSLDEQVGRVRGDTAAMNSRIDRIQGGLDRIERRPDLRGPGTPTAVSFSGCAPVSRARGRSVTPVSYCW